MSNEFLSNELLRYLSIGTEKSEQTVFVQAPGLLNCFMLNSAEHAFFF